MSLFRNIAGSVLAAGLGLFLASPAAAQRLEDCDDDNLSIYGEPLLCADAAGFGAQAAFIRDALMADQRGIALFDTAKASDYPFFGMAALAAQNTSGNFTGNGANLILGVDRNLNDNTALGIMVFLGRSSLTVPAGPTVEREEALIGPYFNALLGNGDFLSGYLVYGQPNYEVANVPSQGESLTGALTWSRNIVRDGVDYAPFAALSVKRERPNGTDRLDATVLTVGTSLNFEPVRTESGYRQTFARFELDFGNFRDSFSNDINYIAPRAAIGANFAFDNGGALQLTANASAASDQTAIVAAQVMYRMEF